MYSQPLSPTPSTTACTPELRTAKRSPAQPAANNLPPVAPYKQVLPAMVALWLSNDEPSGGRITSLPPAMPLPT